MLSRLSWPDFPVPVGVIRNVRRPTHDELLTTQLEEALASNGPRNLQDLLNGSDTWVVE
jgi:2-oxoglutarate ferredoxin oxidoreductase subunit beta